MAAFIGNLSGPGGPPGAGSAAALYGVYPGTVTDIKDAAKQGRVQVKFPWALPLGAGEGYQVWARLSTLMAGPNQGSWVIPDVDTEVLVSFAAGNPAAAYVIGMLWNGVDTPPEQMDDDGKNVIHSITTRTGVKITLDDTDNEQKVIIKTPAGRTFTMSDGPDKQKIISWETPGGQNIKLTDDPNQIEIWDANNNKATLNDKGTVWVDSNGNKMEMTSSGIKLTDKNANTVTLDGSGITLKDKNQNQIQMSGSGVQIQDAQQHKVTLSAAGVAIDSAVQNTSIQANNVQVNALLSAQIQATSFGVQSKAATQIVSTGPFSISTPATAQLTAGGAVQFTSGAALQLTSGAMLQLTAGALCQVTAGTNIMLTAPIQVMATAPMTLIASPLVTMAALLTVPTLTATSVVSPAYTPGAGNFL